jgi:hypothetical protein
MQLRPDYHMSKIVDSDRFRQQEREHGIRRALQGDAPSEGMMSRIAGGLGHIRLMASGRPAIQGVHVLTDKVCRLADGSTGRIAIRESNGEFIEVCVPA